MASASIIKSNVIQHAACRITTGLDSRIVVGYLIGDINPASTDSAFVQALSCPDLPARGSALPGFSPSLFALDFEPRPFKNSKTRMWVLITYRPQAFDPIGEATFELRSTTKVVTRAYANGKVIKMSWLQPDALVGLYHRMPAQIGQITDTVAVDVLTCSFVTFTDPAPTFRPFRNTVNSGPFNGAAKWCVWMSEVGIMKERFQSGWRVYLEMQHDPETWLQTAFWRDIGGIIPKDIDVIAASTANPGEAVDKGYTRGTLKRQASFSDLLSAIPGSSLVPSF